MPEQDPNVRNKNFLEVAMGYTEEMAMEEASRCLNCKNKPCVSGCPVNVRIPEFVAKVAEGKFEEAYEIITSTNSLPAISGRVCPQENQCEGKCVRGIKGESVSIGRLERFCADYHMKHSDAKAVKPQSNGKKVAVVGAGPSGLTCAGDLAKKGYEVTVFEAFHTAGGVLVYGIPEFRLPKAIVKKEVENLQDLGVEVKTNMVIGRVLSVDELFEMGYKAIFIGTGVWRPNTLHIKGESLGNVHYAINYLQNPDVYHLGSRVIVIGAGNAAMDVARTAIRHGTRHLECFSLSKTISASEYEASYAKLEGVNFIFNKKPVEITDKGVVFIDLNEAEDGTLTELPGTEKLYPADSVIVSISQGPCTTITDSTKDLKTTPRGLFETDEVGRTSIPGIFASGDAVKGARTVVEAVAYSKNVAEAMHEYMQTLPPDLPDEYANVPVAEYGEGN